jgi:hypothetical protein
MSTVDDKQKAFYALPESKPESMLKLIGDIQSLHRTAENLAWTWNTKAYREAQERFNVAVWNHGPMLFSELGIRLTKENVSDQ